jgi:hypothetical protein
MTDQTARIAALGAAREDGYTEGTIAGMATAAAMAHTKSGKVSAAIATEIVADLLRRFPHNDRVTYHLRLRGLLP